MNRIWIGADWHFYSINNDTRHPFYSRYKLGKFADNFAQNIQEDDLLIFLGDLCDPAVTKLDDVANIIRAIPCYKIMCRGNHDVQDDEFYKAVGFDEITEIARIHNMLFSHKPIKVAPDEINIHAHLHTKKLVTSGYQHINAYAANWNEDGGLILLEDLLDAASNQQIEIKSHDAAHIQEKFDKYTTFESDVYTKIIDLSDDFQMCPIDEASVKKNSPKLYFLSKHGDWHESVIKPRIPDNFLTRNGYEDKKTPRVCFSTSINGCLRGLSQNLTNTEFYVYMPDGVYDIKTPSLNQVPDSQITNERWITTPVTLKKIGKIKVIGDTGEDGLVYTYGNNKTAELYDWNWEWLEKYDNLSESQNEPLDEILFPDVESTKYWLADDKSFRKKADKGDAEATDTAGVAIDESSFADVKRIVDNIPKEEHHFFYNGGTFKNSPYVIYRNVAYVPHVRGKIGAFIEVYAFDDAPDIGIVVIAAEPAARGKGLTDKLIENAVKTLSIKGIRTLYWRCDADNIASYRLAERNGFILNNKKTTKEQYVFTRDISNEISEAVADTHSLDREQKKDIADKYDLRNVGASSEAEEEDRKAAEERERRKKEEDRIKALEKKAKERNNNLKKARKAKKRKAFKRKLISKLPGVVHESVDIGDAKYLEHPETDHSELWGDRIQFFEPKERFENPKAIDEIESIQESYTFEMAEYIQFFDRMNESTHHDTKLYPVYIMLMHSGTALANAIKKVTNSQFSHCSISFDSSMTQMYSFGRKFDMNPFIGGFKKEDIRSEFFKNKQIPYALYVVPCTQDQIAAMKKRLDYFVKNATKFRYDFTGLLKNYFGIADNPEYKWFCSRFVADILNAGRPSPEPYIVEPSLMKPEDFRYTTFAQYVTGGYLNNYHQKFVENVTKRILRTEMLKQQKITKIEDQFNETAYGFDRDNPWVVDVLNYQLTVMDESTVDTFMQYLQSFKIRFNKNGDIIITRREYDQLDVHFRNSLKMIKAHEKAGNVDGVKDELCKIYYMIELINKYYLRDDVKNMRSNAKDVRKDMLDLRSVMLNVFQQHLKYVTTREPRFNFNTYYENSKYGKKITIPQKVITSVGKAIVTVLK